MNRSRRVEGGHCPVAGTDRPLAFLGSTEALSGYDVEAWECQVCGAVIHEPTAHAPFGRHRRVNCPIECLGLEI